MTDDVAAEWAIRPESPLDLDQINDLHRVAFDSPVEAELVDTVRASAGFIPELSLVAVTADGSVLGHVMVSQVMLHHHVDPDQPVADEASQATDDAPRTEPVLALAPLAVLPPHWDRGIGSALVRAALAFADLRDEPFVVVLGGQGFYRRFGFEPAADFGVTGPFDVPDEVYRLRPRGGDGPVPPGRVSYPPAFEEV